MKPYEWGHPQFDAANHREYFEFEEREPYVEHRGLRYRPVGHNASESGSNLTSGRRVTT